MVPSTKDTRFRHHLVATVVCGYKGFRRVLIATAVCGYKGCRISVNLIATVVCGYKGYQISAYSHGSLWLQRIPDFRLFSIHVLITTAVCGYKGYAISALLVYSGLIVAI